MPKTMSTAPAASSLALDALVARLESLSRRATIEELSRWLGEADVSLDDVRRFVRFGATYQRNLICQGRFFELLCICWASGQRSPIHNHVGSTCGLKVLEGIATETVYQTAPCGQKLPIRSIDLASPLVTASQDQDTHQISNLQPAERNLVTLHIYSPPLRVMDKFSITGEPAGTYCPQVIEFVHGSGI